VSTFKIVIDRSLCSGFGACAELAPEIFQLGTDGIAEVRVGTSDDPGVVDAAFGCPMGAIAVFDLASGEQAA
jgi:ferredoxin